MAARPLRGIHVANIIIMLLAFMREWPHSITKPLFFIRGSLYRMVTLHHFWFVGCDIFTSEPHNVVVKPGARVAFDCVYDVSHSHAIWIINGQDYAHFSPLPPKYSILSNISGSYLIIYDVDLSMNGSAYQCAVDSCYSRVGRLLVGENRWLSITFTSMSMTKYILYCR